MATRVVRQHANFSRRLLAVLVLQLAFCGTAIAEYRGVDDIKPFGLLNVSGYFRTGYLLDDQDRSGTGAGSLESRTTWEEEFFFLTESFIYHPGFLNMEFGGGPLFIQQQFDSVLGDVSDSGSQFNLLARLNFLELKTYPFSVYYERTHPSVTTSLAGRFLTQNDIYGASGRISDLLGGSTTVRYKLEGRATDGGVQGWIVDDQTDTISIQVETGYRKSDSLKLMYDRFDTESGTGSPGLSLFRSKISQELSQLESRNRFGADNRLDVFQTFRLLKQETDAQRRTNLDDRRYFSDIRLQITDKTRSYLRYRWNDTRHSFSRSESQEVELGLVRQANRNLQYDVVAEHSTEAQTGFDRTRSQLRSSFSYARELGFGRLGLSGSLSGARTDQQSSVTDIAVFDETHVLNGTTPVNLLNEFVVVGSVVVSSATRTQIYVEGIDYRLVVIGNETAIQRLIGGSINDGETVVVDYSYETTGTAGFDTLGTSFSANVGFLNTLNAYVTFDSQNTRLRSGEFTNPINDRNSLELGLTSSNQFLDGWTLNAQFRHRIQDEEISPYVSDTLEVSVVRSLFGTWKTTVGGNMSVVEFENSTEDVDQLGYRFSLSGRLFRSAHLTYDAAYLTDTGGTLARKQVQHRLNFQWAYRQVRFALRALYSDDELGASTRTTKQITAQVTRNF